MLELAGSQDSNSSTSAAPTSVRRKRIACDNCHFSKVRCTGETTGCQRCERVRKMCHYSESNMGRLPAGVGKRRKPSSHMNLDVFAAATHPQEQQQNDWDSISPFENVNGGELQTIQHAPPSTLSEEHQAPPSTASEDRGSSDMPIDDTMILWDEPNVTWEQHQQEQQQSKTLAENTSSELDSIGFDPLMSTFDDINFSDMEDEQHEFEESPLDLSFPRLAVAQASRSSPTTSQNQLQPQLNPSQVRSQAMQAFNTPPSLTLQSYQNSNNGFVQTADTISLSTEGVQLWTTQLEELSRTLQKSPIPLDGMLHHSSQLLPCIKEAVHSLHSADVSSSSTSLILILICLTQAITLFEQCVPSVLGGRLTAGSSDLSLRLGDFQVDRKAQQALQMHIVSKELSSILQVSNLIRQALLRQEWRSVSKRTHELLLEDLQVRTVTLVYQMKQKKNKSKTMTS
ncbi:hypothetical protein BOTCAL_1482g00010 [Botryotinia calthae]|uniref:Zn(2)-C6 fungal-type domain-containing protein n=1 Tax=Botryotinia calthae TaxID=38488 RepID=A0A4Y8CBS3_9HELO|nr:hypothetical protein BOTCAL_1482g00010 [Botryotinia calthae]